MAVNLYITTILVLLFAPLLAVDENKNFVTGGYYGGRLGNQFFQIAAVINLALDNKAEPVFPDYSAWNLYDIPDNMKHIFFRLSIDKPSKDISVTYYEDPDFHYAPIPYTPNMKVYGYFQSEKYFKNHKKEVIELFSPSKEIVEYLHNKYQAILAHPKTVGVHLRAYGLESTSIYNMLVPVGSDYVSKAAEFFDKDTLFVIFSDKIYWAQDLLKKFSRPHIFVQDEKHYYDFYLLSLMKHQIISNSSFSWWAAYLNPNPNKIVIAPMPWFQPNWHIANGNEHIIPDGWITLRP